jgi:TonB family protein
VVAPPPQIAEAIRPRPSAAPTPAPVVRDEPKPAGGSARPEKPAGAPGFVLPAATVAVAPGAISEPPPPAAVAPPPAPAPAPVAAETPAPKPAAAAPAAFPTIPYYELVQVDRPPQVTSRVEPRLESVENLTKEIVIVRVLVSHSGQPHLVRLLRPSKSGPALDAAVIAAVEQWTFKPAARRGEAVSCWLHTAVTIAR